MTEERLTLRQSLRVLPRPAWLLFGGSFVNRFGSFVVVFLVLYLRAKGYSVTDAGLAVSAYGFGGVGSALAGGYLADRLGRRNAIALSMFGSAAAMLALSQADTLGAIVVLTALEGLASELYRTFLVFLLASIAGAFVYFQQQTTLPLHVQDSGLSKAVYGALISLNGLVVVLVELPLTALTRRVPARPVMALGMLLIGVGFGLTGVAHTVPLLALTVTVWTLGEIVNAPVAAAYVADISPARLRGRYQGAWTLTWGIGLILAPTIGTRLYAWSPDVLWGACFVLGTIAAALVLASPARRVEPAIPEGDLGLQR